MLRALVLAAIAADPQWGTLDLPPGFALSSSMPLAGTAAAAPAPPGVQGRLVALFMEQVEADGGAREPALIAVSRVDAPLPSDTERETAYSEVFAHFHQDLAVDAHVDRPVVRGDHLEVSVEVERPQGTEAIRLGFYAAGEVHYVLWASYPVSRAGQLAARLDTLFDSYRPPGGPVPISAGRRRVGQAWAVALIGLGVILGVRLWRRRRAPPEKS